MADKGWVERSEIDARLGYKILIAGLAEAGKTAVKRLFFLKHKTEDVDGLSATLSFERLSVDINKTPVTILDLGGQRIFLKRFLTTFSPFIYSSVVTFVFLIDVSNRTTRNNSVQYFTACLEKLQKYSPDAQIFVFLHKNDLVEKWPNYESIHVRLMEEFQVESIKTIKFFRTTIFNPETVITGFGRIIELSMPELSQSELVDGRIIGEKEEYTKKAEPSRKPLALKTNGKPTKKEAPIFEESEDPAYLERIQNLMKGSIVDESVTPMTSQSTLREAIMEEMVEETVLNHVTSPEKKNQAQTVIYTQDTSEQVEVNREISSLVEYYGIEVELGTEIVKSGYNSLFKMAVTAGVPITLVGDVITKYIPSLKSKELNIKNLTLDRLLDIFSSYLRGSITQDDIFSCLIFAIEKPKMSIDDITVKYLVKTRRKAKMRVRKEGLMQEISQQTLPIETEVVEGVIELPDTKGIGFKANLAEDLAYLSFYCENRIVSRSKISPRISVEELKYLLSFEMNLQSLGFIRGGERSITFSARIIHEALFQMREGMLKSTADIKGINIAKIMRIKGELD